MLVYLIIKFVCWLWGIVPDEPAMTMFAVFSFFETIFEIWTIVAAIGSFTESPEHYQRTLKELYESDLFKDKKDKK